MSTDRTRFATTVSERSRRLRTARMIRILQRQGYQVELQISQPVYLAGGVIFDPVTQLLKVQNRIPTFRESHPRPDWIYGFGGPLFRNDVAVSANAAAKEPNTGPCPPFGTIHKDARGIDSFSSTASPSG
jgi:hypothetical protein